MRRTAGGTNAASIDATASIGARQYHDINAALAHTGLRARGGFHPRRPGQVPEVRPGVACASLILIGSVGPQVWPAFAAARPPVPDPLDHWTRSALAPLAERLRARAVYPEDRPFQPFQQWALRAENVHRSPLGLLIHPQYGLWHCYRAALLLPDAIDLPVAASLPSPCAACSAKPCLHACPVDAFMSAGFDAAACHAHLDTAAGRHCLQRGCQARDACPVGREHRYAPEQVRFHMAAFHRPSGASGN